MILIFSPSGMFISRTVIYQHQFPFIPSPPSLNVFCIFLQENTSKTFSIPLTEEFGIIMISGGFFIL